MPKFTPTKPFALYEEGTNHGNLSKASAFYSELIRTHIDMGGVIVNVYRFIGTYEQNTDALGIKYNRTGGTRETTDINTFMGIEDPILLENRTRAWNMDEISRLKGVYTVSQNELEYARFGLGLANDVITMEFHVGEMEKQVGRRMIIGDIVEMEHLREVSISGKKIANKFYEVSSITWSPQGYDPMYARHVLGVVLKPLRYQQEFMHFYEKYIDEYGKTLVEQATNVDQMLAINDAVIELAKQHANTTQWDTTLLWFDPNDPNRVPDRWTDDGLPDNGLVPVGKGNAFPTNAVEGDWFVRDDFSPARLYRLESNRWRLREYDRKREWQPYNYLEKAREFMSDQSLADDSRPYELRGMHDVLTDREERSEPSPKSKQYKNTQ